MTFFAMAKSYAEQYEETGNLEPSWDTLPTSIKDYWTPGVGFWAFKEGKK